MRHTVCGQPVVMDRVTIPEKPPLILMVPHCPTCGRYVEAIDELTDTPRVSPGRDWELLDEDDGA